MNLQFSIIVPVYNRPQEIDELLESLTKQELKDGFEVLIVEDGSENASEEVINKYISQLNLNYFLRKIAEQERVVITEWSEPQETILLF